MKKFVLALLLFCLCLSLAACELPFDLPFDLPFQGSQTQGDDYTIIYRHMESGDHVAAMEELGTISHGKMPEDKNMMAPEIIKARYSELDACLQAKDYSAAAKIIAKMSCESYQEHISQKEHPVGGHLFCNWYGTYAGSHMNPLLLSTFGTIESSPFNGELVWIIESINEYSLQIRTYDVESLEYTGDILVEKTPENNYFFQFSWKRENASPTELVYTHHRLLSGGDVEVWHSVAQDADFPQDVTLQINGLRADGDYYELLEEEDRIIARSQEYDQQYEISLQEFAPGHHALELCDGNTRALYYHAADLEYGTIAYHYERALEVLPLLQGADDGLDFYGDERSQQAWFDYVYQSMLAASEYADGYHTFDTATILGRFTILEDMLIGIGPQRNLLNQKYKYDVYGRVIFAEDPDLTLQYYGAIDMGDGKGTIYAHQYHYEYDNNGRISKITHMDYQDLVSTITPVYDAAGKIDRLDIQMADGTQRSANYVYDSDMMMPFSTVPTAKELDVLREINYGEHFLNFSWTPDFENYWFSGVMGWIMQMDASLSYSSNWETDENHVLIKKTIFLSDEYGETIKVITYSYDENGRLVSEHIASTRGENSWETTNYYYYENLYFYDFNS